MPGGVEQVAGFVDQAGDFEQLDHHAGVVAILAAVESLLLGHVVGGDEKRNDLLFGEAGHLGFADAEKFISHFNSDVFHNRDGLGGLAWKQVGPLHAKMPLGDAVLLGPGPEAEEVVEAKAEPNGLTFKRVFQKRAAEEVVGNLLALGGDEQGRLLSVDTAELVAVGHQATLSKIYVGLVYLDVEYLVYYAAFSDAENRANSPEAAAFGFANTVLFETRSSRQPRDSAIAAFLWSRFACLVDRCDFPSTSTAHFWSGFAKSNFSPMGHSLRGSPCGTINSGIHSGPSSARRLT